MTVELATALRMIAAAHAEAERRSILVSAAVVDAGGQNLFIGPDGKGNQDIGTPDLTDDYWMYGSSRDTMRRYPSSAQSASGATGSRAPSASMPNGGASTSASMP